MISTNPTGCKPAFQSQITILGSTGSIGKSTLDIIARNPALYGVQALVAGKNAQALAAQAKAIGARHAVVADEKSYAELKACLQGTHITCAAGAQAVVDAARMPADITVSAIVGAAGLPATMAAIQQGKRVALANKESLVCGGDMVLQAVQKYGTELLPVDSEHSAIFQVLDQKRPQTVDKIILTASGGPFIDTPLADMYAVTPAQAVAHPNWSMGAKISVDSATMMNKGLELIEAKYLFQVSADDLDVLVHRQSIIHSLVAYKDGSVLAQLGMPDMRTPIAYALAYPSRIAVPVSPLNLAEIGTLDFKAPDMVRFPALQLAYDAMRAGSGSSCFLNAANEVAVAAFLAQRIGFMDIPALVSDVMQKEHMQTLSDIEHVFAQDAAARQHADAWLKAHTGCDVVSA
jgi:1-deoxy-D-xylulose-5-phosphate reductoisomerase